MSTRRYIVLLSLYSLHVRFERLLDRRPSVFGHFLPNVKRHTRAAATECASALLLILLVVPPFLSGRDRIPERRRQASGG